MTDENDHIPAPRRSGINVAEGAWADGVLVRAGSPLETLWVPLDGGLTVLYGRNGSGKTRILDKIGQAFRGVAPPDGEVSLHLSFGPPFESFTDTVLQGLAIAIGALDADDYQREIAELVEPQEMVEDAAIELTAGIARRLAAEHRQFESLAGLVHTPRIAMVASGTDSKPAWRLHLSLSVTDVPTLRAAVDAGAGRIQDQKVSIMKSSWGPFVEALMDRGLPDDYIGPLVFGDVGVTDWMPDERYAEGAFELVEAATMNWLHYDPHTSLWTDPATFSCRIADDEPDLHQRTAELLRLATDRDLIAGVDGGSIEWSPEVIGRMESLANTASLVLQSLTGDPLAALRLDLFQPRAWLTRSPIEWRAADLTGRWVPVDSLGSGGRRWARLAISVALQGLSLRRPQVLIVDEPERALHTAAQRDAAAGFTAVASDKAIGGVPVSAAIVATHSPAFLAQPGTLLVRVSRRSDGNVRLDPIDMTAGIEGLVAELGLTRADALLAVRTFVFVEGAHDVAVLTALFGETFAARHAVVRPMRGAKNVEPYVTAEHVLAYSDATIRVVLDAVGVATTKRWDAARAAAASGDVASARKALTDLTKQPGSEARWLQQAGFASLDRGQIERVEVIGLKRPDIIQYLPAGELVPGASSWKPLVTEWRALPQPRPPFKEWLRRSKGATVDTRTIRGVAERLDGRSLDDLHTVVEGL